MTRRDRDDRALEPSDLVAAAARRDTITGIAALLLLLALIVAAVTLSEGSLLS